MTHLVETVNDHSLLLQNAIDGNGLPISGNGWPPRPFQIVSLREMNRLYAYTFCAAYLKFCEVLAEIQGGFIEFGPDAVLSELKATEVNIRVNLLLHECEKAGLTKAGEEAFRIKHIGTPTHEPDKYPLHVIQHELIQIHRDVNSDLSKRKFFALSDDESKQYNLKHPFGEKVHLDFESTRYDVAEAWKCFCLGRYTGSVFHAMRILEKGLHALVSDLNAKFNTGIVFKKGIEFQSWGTLIGKIDKEIKALLNPNRQPPLNPGDLQFYAEAAKEFEYFKAGWRDDSAHARSKHDEKEARLVLDHVNAFMRHLVDSGLKE